MTISTPPTKLQRASGCHGFTLTEVMIAATISTFILAGVLSAFLLMSRSGFASSSYSEMEMETRRALDIFGTDVRTARDIQWNSSQSVTLREPTASNATVLVTYAYDNVRGSPTFECFYRKLGDAASTNPRRILVHRVASDFAFQRFKLEQSGVADNIAVNDLETKQIQVTLRATRTGVTAVTASQSALSASYILRNKRVSN